MVMKKAPKGGGKGAKGTSLYVPVKQSTIDNIKKMGMAAALKKAGKSGNAEFVQGVKRMYGADRLKKAMAANKPVAKSADAARASYSKAKPAAAKPKAKATTKPAASKPDWRKTGIGPVIKKNIKSGDWRKKGLLG